MSKLFLLLALVVSCWAKPELILQNERLPNVPTFVATTNVGSDNQLCLPQEIKATRVCINEGVWIFYPDTNYLANTSPALVEVNPAGSPSRCLDLPANLDRQLGSYRPAGDPLGAPCSLNLYVNKDYAATENMTIVELFAVPFAFNSVIRTGENCNWEFFMKEGHEGFSECFSESEFLVPDFFARFGVNPGDIKSIKLHQSPACPPRGKLNPSHVFKGY